MKYLPLHILSLTLCTCKGDIVFSAILNFWRFIAVVWYIGCFITYKQPQATMLVSSVVLNSLFAVLRLQSVIQR